MSAAAPVLAPESGAPAARAGGECVPPPSESPPHQHEDEQEEQEAAGERLFALNISFKYNYYNELFDGELKINSCLSHARSQRI